MNKKKNLGKVVKQLNGYRIRQMLHSVKVQISKTKSVVRWLHTGEYGLYAGKKLIKTGKSVEELG